MKVRVSMGMDTDCRGAYTDTRGFTRNRMLSGTIVYEYTLDPTAEPVDATTVKVPESPVVGVPVSTPKFVIFTPDGRLDDEYEVTVRPLSVVAKTRTAGTGTFSSKTGMLLGSVENVKTSLTIAKLVSTKFVAVDPTAEAVTRRLRRVRTDAGMPARVATFPDTVRDTSVPVSAGASNVTGSPEAVVAVQERGAL